MADTKISAMPAADPLDGTEIVPLVQTGTNVQTTTTDFVSETIQTDPASFRTDLGLGTIATQDANNVNITGGTITSTTVNGYVPTTRTLTAGTGLTGGGDLSANRTFAIANTAVVAGTYGSATKIPVITFNAQGQATNASEQTLSAASINLAYGSFLQNGSTTLTDSISNNSTTPITVGDTTEFASSGYVIIEQEVIQYVGKSSTQLGTTSVTRGVKGTTNVSHNPGVAVSEAAAVPSATTEAVIGYDTTIYSNNISIVSASRVTFAVAGLYNIQFSLQLLNYTTSEDNVTVWLRVNGVDIPQSASVQQVNAKHGSAPGAAILALNLFQQVTAGQYVELAWSSITGDSVLGTFPAGTNPTRPISPAVILTVVQVA